MSFAQARRFLEYVFRDHFDAEGAHCTYGEFHASLARSGIHLSQTECDALLLGSGCCRKHLSGRLDRSGKIDVGHFVQDYCDGFAETARRAALRRVGGDKVGTALHFDEDTGTWVHASTDVHNPGDERRDRARRGESYEEKKRHEDPFYNAERAGAEELRKRLPLKIYEKFESLCGTKAFRYFDKNHDGVVTVDEVAEVCREHNLPTSYVKTFVDLIDRNGDGELQIHELQEFFAQGEQYRTNAEMARDYATRAR